MKNPIRIVFVLACLITLSSCSKYVEEKQKNLLLSVMTEGQWHVEEYLEGGVTSIKDKFEGYNFQFASDGSVLGVKGAFKIKGNWKGDINNYSISSNFPSTEDPIARLNGVWRIIDSAIDYVEAEMSTGRAKNILRLRKNG